MMEKMATTFYLVLILLCVAFCVIWFNVEYNAVKKYYPDITPWEYFVLQQKLRITPED